MTDSTLPLPPPSAGESPADEASVNEDDRRAAAAAVNRKRALEEWEANKKRWRDMGVPTGLPAKK
jgi:hypothetical protein